MSGTRTITRDPNRVTNAQAARDTLKLHQDRERTTETVKQDPTEGTVQADIEAFTNYHHEQALSDVAADSTGQSTADNDYLTAVEDLNGAYATASSDGELSVEEQDELLDAAGLVSEAEIASRDAFYVDDSAHMDPSVPTDPIDSSLPGVNPPLSPDQVPDPSNFTYVAAPTAQQIAQGAPLGFGHDDDGDNMIVSDVQQQLFDGGYYGDAATADEVDGYFGPRTQSAVEAFQSDRGLEVTGEIRNDDLVALGLTDAPVDADPATDADAADATPSLADGAPEVVELRNGTADSLERQGQRLAAQGYLTDGMGTYYHPDIAIQTPTGTSQVAEAQADRLREQGYVAANDGRFYHPDLAHLIPGQVVDFGNVPDGIARAEAGELRASGYVAAGNDIWVHPDLIETVSGSPMAAERQSERLRADGWRSDGMGTYYHPGVAQHFLS